METELCHGEGDLEGEPLQLAPHLIKLLYRWFEFEPLSGLYIYDNAVVGYPKGSIKTELEAGLGLEHLEGPSTKHGTRVVNVNAVDGEQADKLVATAAMMIPKGSDLESRLIIENGRIAQRKAHGSGRMKALSSAIGKNDGLLPSLNLNDELHEWDSHSTAGAKRHGVQERGTNKRRNARNFNASTAGWTLESLLGGLYQYGMGVTDGSIVDPRFLFEWWEGSEHWDLDDAQQLVAAIRECNPMAPVTVEIVDRLVRSYAQHKLRGEENDWIRYHLNRWIGGNDEAWMDVALWAKRAAKARKQPPEGSSIVLGFDGSWKHDSTALVGATVEHKPHVFVVASWAQDDRERRGRWQVDPGDVLEKIRWACSHWDVKEMAADTSFWQTQLYGLQNDGVVTIEDFQQSAKRLTLACQRMYEHVADGLMTHDGDRRLQRHIGNCRRKQTEFGVRVEKEHEHSRRYIDLAAAAIFAHERALWWALSEKPTEPLFAIF